MTPKSVERLPTHEPFPPFEVGSNEHRARLAIARLRNKQKALELNRTNVYHSGEKVVYIPEEKVYEFGSYSKINGMCTIFEDGHISPDFSYSVKLSSLRKTFHK
jgi:hypothetical protein